MQNCMCCGKGFSVTVRKVRAARKRDHRRTSACDEHLFIPLWLFSTTADTVGTFSVASVHQGTPSHRPPKSQCGSARLASRSSKADSLSSTSLNKSILPLSYSSRQKTACLCPTLTCTIAGRRHAESCTLAPGSGWRFQ